MTRVRKIARIAAGIGSVSVLSVAGVEVVERLEERDWAAVIPELVSKIADHLLADDVTEYIRLRAVCKPWRSSTADPSLLEPRFFPRYWLLLAREHLRDDGEAERFVNVRTGTSLHICLPDPDQYTHRGNVEGLLLLHHTFSDTICLLNPLTTALYDLPTMHAVNDVVGPNEEYPDDDQFLEDSIKAAGIIVDMDELGQAQSVPTVVLSLTIRNDTAIVCAKPGDNGGLSVRGRFFIPTCAGEVLAVELQPQPHLKYVAKMFGDQIQSGFDEISYLVPSCDDQDSGMLLVRAQVPNGSTKYAVNLYNGTLSLKEPNGITVFLPSVTIRSSAFPLVLHNTIYVRCHMKRLLR
ncbi:hypothetical protein EJB05_01254, partial [Eragrostis curvula]